jgi:hypothetical protein
MDKFKDFKNEDLKQYCIDEGVDVDSKNVSKPTRKEYIDSILAFEAKAAQKEEKETEEFLSEPEPATPVVAKKEVKKEVSKKDIAAQKRAFMNKRIRVLITSNSTNQTKTGGLERITWGNRVLGHHTDNVVLGRPWHVREGALNNMRQAMTRNSIQDDEGNQVRWETVPTYNIQILEPLTESEINKIARRQTIRDASIESLI